MLTASRPALESVGKLLGQLTRAEKAQVLRWVADDLAGDDRGIERTPGVCGGEARVAGTRVPVWVLQGYRELGKSDAELLVSYPSIRAEDLANAWAYVRAHSDEIRELIAENDANEDDDDEEVGEDRGAVLHR